MVQPSHSHRNNMTHKYTKQTTIGDEACTVMDVREAFVRKTLLPANWKRVRVGAFVSLCGTSGDNAPFVAETLPCLSPLDELLFGLVNVPNLAPGRGANFVGYGIFHGTDAPINIRAITRPKIPFLAAGNTDFFRGGFLNASGGRVGVGVSGGQRPGYCTPDAAAGYACLLRGDYTLNDNGTITVGAYNDSNNSGYTDTSILALRGKLSEQPTSSQTSSTAGPLGWWGAASPVNCPYLYIRCPYMQNRLRIHAWEVMQVA